MTGVEATRRKNFAHILDKLESLIELDGARLLEIGSGSGLFLEQATKRGACVIGLEADREAVDVARARGLTVLHGFFPAALPTAETFEVIALNDVFEHLPNPDAGLQLICEILAPGGVLMINLPSSGGVFFRVASFLDRLGLHGPYDRLWQRGLPSPHLSYFSPSTLDLMVNRQTTLVPVAHIKLVTVSRNGLRERIQSVETGLPSPLVFCMVWCLTWILGCLPRDLFASFYRNGGHGVPFAHRSSD